MIGPLASLILFWVSLMTGINTRAATMRMVQDKGAMQNNSQLILAKSTIQSMIPLKSISEANLQK